MPSARNLLSAAGGKVSKPLPTYPTFPENQSSLLAAREMTWIDDDVSQTEKDYRGDWSHTMAVVRYPFQNIAITFRFHGEGYTTHVGDKLVAHVYDYRDSLNVVDSGPQSILDVMWDGASAADDGMPMWSWYLDVVPFGDRLLGTFLYQEDYADGISVIVGLAFCTITIDTSTLAVTVHWDGAYKHPVNTAWPRERTLHSDPWGDLAVCQLWYYDGTRNVADFIKLRPSDADPNAIDGSFVSHDVATAELGWEGVDLWNSAIDGMTTPPPGEKIIAPWAQAGIEYYKDDLWVIGWVGQEKRDEYVQLTDYAYHHVLYLQMVEITESSFTLVDEIRVADDFAAIPAGVRLNACIYYYPYQWYSQHEHGFGILDDVCLIMHHDYNDTDGDYGRYARVGVSESGFTLLERALMPAPQPTTYTRTEEHWALTKCDGKFVIMLCHYPGDGGHMDLIVIGPDGTVHVNAQDTRPVYEANVPATAWLDNTVRTIGGASAVYQVNDVQNSKILPLVLPDIVNWNTTLVVLSHLDALITDSA